MASSNCLHGTESNIFSSTRINITLLCRGKVDHVEWVRSGIFGWGEMLVWILLIIQWVRNGTSGWGRSYDRCYRSYGRHSTYGELCVSGYIQGVVIQGVAADEKKSGFVFIGRARAA